MAKKGEGTRKINKINIKPAPKDVTISIRKLKNKQCHSKILPKIFSPL